MSAAAPPGSPGTGTLGAATTVRAILLAAGRSVLTTVVVLAVIVVLWVVALRVFDVSEYVGKTPADVWTYLVGEEDAAANRAEILGMLDETLRDASLGFVTGMVAATVLAALIVRFRAAENAVMPVAMILRSVPLIALAPIIILLVGRGFAAVAVMSGIVVLFPALVNIVLGLRSVTPQLRDVVTVYGGGEWDTLRRVAFPSALPALFASIRISVPGSITGALLAEWLATGEGIGYGVVSAAGRSQNSKVWAMVVVITLVSLVLYLLAQLVERFVLARFSTTAGQA